MTRRTLRLAALAAVAVLVLPLTACQSHQGTTAHVGKTRITSDQLDEQVDKFYADPYWAKLGENQRPLVRDKMVYALVMAELFKQVANGAGAKVTQSELDAIVARVKKEPSEIQQQYNGVFVGSTPEVYAKIRGHLDSIQKHLAAKAGSPEEAGRQFEELLGKAGAQYPVRLNPRFGRFDSKALAIVAGSQAGVRDLPAATPSPGEGPPQQGEQPQPPPGEVPPGEVPPGEVPPGEVPQQGEQPVPDQPAPPAN